MLRFAMLGLCPADRGMSLPCWGTDDELCFYGRRQLRNRGLPNGKRAKFPSGDEVLVRISMAA